MNIAKLAAFDAMLAMNTLSLGADNLPYQPSKWWATSNLESWTTSSDRAAKRDFSPDCQ
jgi:hypothetical protein